VIFGAEDISSPNWDTSALNYVKAISADLSKVHGLDIFKKIIAAQDFIFESGQVWREEYLVKPKTWPQKQIFFVGAETPSKSVFDRISRYINYIK